VGSVSSSSSSVPSDSVGTCSSTGELSSSGSVAYRLGKLGRYSVDLWRQKFPYKVAVGEAVDP
jgi:hypothetical protein